MRVITTVEARGESGPARAGLSRPVRAGLLFSSGVVCGRGRGSAHR